jgi:hypothetical protein
VTPKGRALIGGCGVTDTWCFASGSNLSLDRKVERAGVVRRAVLCRLPAAAALRGQGADFRGRRPSTRPAR